MRSREDTNALLKHAVVANGTEAQWEQVVEECAELIVAIKHTKRGKATVHDLLEEIADVIIMSQQARLMAGPSLVDAVVEAKLDRLEKQLGEKGAPK